MKKAIFLLFFLSFFNNIQSQEKKEFSILGNNYSFEFEKAHNRFSICSNSELKLICSKFPLKNDDEFALPEMQGKLETYFKEVSTKLDSFDSLEVKLDMAKLKENKKDTLFFTKPIALAAYHIEYIEKDNAYLFKPLNQIIGKLKNYKLVYTTDISASNSTFLSSVKNGITEKLKEGKVELKAALKKKYQELFKDFYKEKVVKSKSYVFLASEELFRTNETDATGFTWYSMVQKEIFFLKVAATENINEFKIYGPFKWDIGESDFVQKVFNQHDQFEKNVANTLTLEKVKALIKAPIEQAIKAKSKKIQDEMVLRVADSIDNIKTIYSGQLKLSKQFELYPTDEDNKANKTFKVVSASVSFFNNRADNITIKGKIDGVDYVSVNKEFSLALREFNQGKEKNKILTRGANQIEYEYHYKDIFEYGPDGNKFNYAIKGEEVQLLPDEPIRIKQRDLSDYFTGIFFTDFLGLNNNNENGLIVAEVQMRFPFHFRNRGMLTWFDNISLYGSANLFSGFESGNRRIVLPNEYSKNPTNFKENDPYLFQTDNFNLLLNNNIDAGIKISPVTLEWKGATTFIHLRYGLRFLRTGVQYSLFERTEATTENEPPTDTLFEERNFQVFTVGQELETHFEIRPQSNIGADLTIGLNWLGATGTSKNDIKFNTINNSANLKVLANIYSLVNPNSKKSGLFFRIGGHYDLGNYKLFPQMMLGYATNLTSFINRSQSK